MKKMRFLLLILILPLVLTKPSYPYAGITHGGITFKAEKQGKFLDKYLRSIGFTDGSDEKLTLLFTDPAPGKPEGCPIVHEDPSNTNCFLPPYEDFQEDFASGKAKLNLSHMEGDKGYDIEFNYTDQETTQKAWEWLLIGSVVEDIPIIRAGHHFHDPTRLHTLSSLRSGQGGTTKSLRLTAPVRAVTH